MFFRESMRQKAAELGITGWVRNRLDGTVEAIVQGSDENVEAISKWARTGPRGAHVLQVDVTEAEGIFHSFERLPTT